MLGYRASTQRTITILPAEEPSPEPEGESPGPGSPGAKETPAVPASAELPAAGPAPSTQCAAAEAARDAALRRIRLIGAKLSRVRGTGKARRLAAAKRRQAATLRRARRRIANAC
jgi:hypothetical protein